MTVRYKTLGFVFKKEDSGEADRIFSVFTKGYGRVELMGKGIRKITSKLKGGMELLRFADIEFIQGKRTKTVTDAISLKTFDAICQSPEKLRCSYALCQLVDGLVKGQEPDEAILDLLIDSFEKLVVCLSSVEQCLLVYHYFFWNFVSALGYGFQVQVCVNCGAQLQPAVLYISYQEGGLLCDECGTTKGGAKKISLNEVKLLRLFHKKEWGTMRKVKISGVLHKSLKKIADEYRDYIIQKVL